ncbi:hypothetical protein DPEC_G00304280 [Dallia pectoralis]|uniref:Uncharacterized protein n=1 Tax=Dallia pectoralis TaxID=75939 RepID=A0ACC2FDK1_DALPE|nr:hypothetical protein DPEC_G00304280 [Dallia pectoralis]
MCQERRYYLSANGAGHSPECGHMNQSTGIDHSICSIPPPAPPGELSLTMGPDVSASALPQAPYHAFAHRAGGTGLADHKGPQGGWLDQKVSWSDGFTSLE